jgi:hypothetical protein
VSRRKDSLVAAKQVTRVEIGHPEGYLAAFANLRFSEGRCCRMRHEAVDQIDRPFSYCGRRRQGPGFCRSRHPKFSLRKVENRRRAGNLTQSSGVQNEQRTIGDSELLQTPELPCYCLRLLSKGLALSREGVCSPVESAA